VWQRGTWRRSNIMLSTNGRMRRSHWCAQRRSGSFAAAVTAPFITSRRGVAGVTPLVDIVGCIVSPLPSTAAAPPCVFSRTPKDALRRLSPPNKENEGKQTKGNKNIEDRGSELGRQMRAFRRISRTVPLPALDTARDAASFASAANMFRSVLEGWYICIGVGIGIKD